jgi:TRAP-type mannitol/chloroaromatic compound transport system permease small subunit
VIARLVDTLTVIAARVAQAELLLLILTIVYEVFCRFGLNAPNVWSYDISYMLSGTLFFLAAAYTLRERAHVTIDALSSRLPHGILRGVHVAFYLLLFLPILGWMTVSTSSKALDAWRNGEVNYTSPWGPVMWPFYSAIAVGLLLLWLQAAILTFEQMTATPPSSKV